MEYPFKVKPKGHQSQLQDQCAKRESTFTRKMAEFSEGLNYTGQILSYIPHKLQPTQHWRM